MKTKTEFCFGPFRVDVVNARLSRDRQQIALKPKVFDVLTYLVRHAGRLVTQEELLHSVWPDTVVGDSSLKSCIRQIRQALDDDVRSPKFIETVHRRGYSFIAPVTEAQGASDALMSANLQPWATPTVNRPPTLVGRDAELGQLHQLLAQARSGQRQLAFVTGNAGSGKTALAEAVLHQVAGDQDQLVAMGQCFEKYGSGEAYLPVLEALSRLARGPGRDALIEVLSRHAPTWLSQLPSLGPVHGIDPSSPHAVSPDRMLREMAEALERLTAVRSMVLVLEDLHWADYSTLDLVSALARRREPARLMVIATYRPSDVVLSGHPLRVVTQDLQARGLCQELPLKLLSEDAVGDYLKARCPGGGLPDGLPRMLHRRTEGQPLFLVSVVDEWLEQGVLAPCAAGSGWKLTAQVETLAVGVPASVRALIEKQIDRLSAEEFRTLEGASVAGVEFVAAAAAAAINEDVLRVEESCDVLARRYHFLIARGSTQWPDGTVSARYRFAHELFHRVVNEGVPPARRRRLHQSLGERLESAYSVQTQEITAELALHFEQGTDAVRAVRYLETAAHRAARLYTYREAIDYIRRGLAALQRLPEPERSHSELRLQLQLGLQLQITKGFADAHARRAFARARDLCDELNETSLRFPTLWGLWLYHKVRSKLQNASSMANELFELAKQLGDPALELQSHQALAVTALCSGQPAATLKHMESGLALYDSKRHHAHTFMFGQDPGVACRSFGAFAFWLLGYPGQALLASREALRLSHELTQPSSQVLALHFAAMLHQCRRDGRAALSCAELALTIAAERGQSFWHAGAMVMRGWAVADCGNPAEGISVMRLGLDSWQSTGSLTYCTYYLALLAEAIGTNGDVDAGLRLLDEALELVEKTSERLFEAELHRLRGELILTRSGSSAKSEAETCFRRSVDVALQQEAKALELRALVSLSRVCRKPRARDEVRSQLSKTLAWFKEETDTPDWQEAKACLGRVD